MFIFIFVSLYLSYIRIKPGPVKSPCMVRLDFAREGTVGFLFFALFASLRFKIAAYRCVVLCASYILVVFFLAFFSGRLARYPIYEKGAMEFLSLGGADKL